MVKLVFNPKKDTSHTILESRTSLKKVVNFNPFSGIEQQSNQNCKQLYHKDLIGLENCYYVLQQWYNDSKKIFLIIGPTGCGKTNLINLFCEQENIKLLNLKLNDNRTKKELLREVQIFIDYSCDFFFKSEKTKKLILIDDYQNISTDTITTQDILDIKELGVPILIISSDSKGSKLSDFKKNCEVYYINEIPHSIIKKWIVSLKTNLIDNQINYLVKNCKSDKRLILNVLQYISINSFNNAEQFLKTYYKDIHINLFEFIKTLFDDNEPIGIENIFKVYDNDGYILSNLVHENYLDYNQDIHSIAKASECISEGEIFFADTYESCKSFLPDIHCMHSIVIPCFYSRSLHNPVVRSSIINNRFNILLNNKKIISKINATVINTFDIYDIYLIKNVLNQELIKSKIAQPHKIEFIKNVLHTLKGIEHLEMIYKHFGNFKEMEQLKTKSFTIKFKEKLK